MRRPDRIVRLRRAPPLLMLAAVGMALAVVPLPFSSVGAGAAEPDARLKEVERALEKGRERQEKLRSKAETLAKEIEQLREESIAAARSAQEFEESASALEATLDKLTAENARKTEALYRRRDQLVRVLSGLERIARRPPEALIAEPRPPIDLARSAMLLRSVIPGLEHDAAEIRRELAVLSDLRTEIAEQRRKLVQTSEKLEAERKRLAGLLRRKSTFQQRTEAQEETEARRVRQLAAEANDIKGLMARLEDERQQRQRREQEARARMDASARARVEADEREREMAALSVEPGGALPLPVRGRTIRKFGDSDGSGAFSKGLSVETRAAAQVTAPASGQVVFAGPFRGYGLLLIIEHSEGYHSLLAGMDRIDGKVGQHLAVGEPVGLMGRPEDGKPILYFELRRNGQPVNPIPWLTARKGKVRG